jgi:sterol desaturase/sphingolipid hydroxylase (fatty acid hydroxylase superfamily)
VEVVTDRAAVRVDVIYTLIHRLGLLRLVFFFTLEPLWERLVGRLHVIGVPAFSVDNLWPGVSDIGWVSLLVYVVLFDAADYAIHRAQHRWHWWWQLHALHHSQRQMTLWSDNRNHLLDSLLRDSLFALLALMVGVPPAQFVAVVVLSQLMESLSHANVRLSFGPLFERVFVSPRYHRLHHAMSLGSEGGSEGGGEGGGEGRPGGHNFAVLLPLWDLLAGTARFDARYEPTGLSDQLQGRDYGRGFWSQQWLGLRRLVQS